MTNIATIPNTSRSVSVDFNDPVAIYLDSDIFGQLQRVAKLMSSASLVPQHLRGESKLGDCFLVAAQAFRWRMDPFAVAQSTYVVSGKLGYEGKLIAGIVNASGKLNGSLAYEYSGEGDARTVIVSGKIKGDDSALTITGNVANWKTNNEQWKKNPDQILAYRGAREWARRHMPEVVLGIQSDDEIGAGASTVTMRDVTDSASPAAAVSAVLAAIEQEADNNAPAVSDAPPPPLGAASISTEAPTGAPKTYSLPPMSEPLYSRACSIIDAIAIAKTVRDLDRIQLAKRATLDDISNASPAAHEVIMQASRDRIAKLGGA